MQGYSVDKLLQHEITNSAFFFMYEMATCGRASNHGLLKLCPWIDEKGSVTPPQTRHWLHNLGKKSPFKEA